MKHVVIVDGYKWSEFIVTQVSNLGYKLIHVQSTAQPLRKFKAGSTYNADQYALSCVYDGNIQNILNQLRDYEVIAVFPGLESGVRLADLLAKSLTLENANGTAKSIARLDKYRMKQALAEYGLQTTQYFRSDSSDEIIDWIKSNTTYPVVLKPLSSCATDGVLICDNEKMVREGCQTILSTESILEKKNHEVLVEAFMVGEEYIVNSVSCGGNHYTTDIWRCRKRNIEGVNVYDREELIDSESKEAIELRNYTFSVLNALEIRFGASHAEVMITSHGPILIEVGARVGGNVNVMMHKKCFTTDQATLNIISYLRSDLFLQLTQKPYQKASEMTHVLLATNVTGVIRGIPLENTIKSLTSFKQCLLSLKVDDVLYPTTTLLTKPGDVWLAHENAEMVRSDYEWLIQQLVPEGFIVEAIENKALEKSDEVNPVLNHSILSVLGILNDVTEKYPEAISLASGRPSAEYCKPSQEIEPALQAFKQYADANLRIPYDQLLGQYGQTQGFIQELVAKHLFIDESIQVNPSEIIITSGFQEGAELCVKTFFTDNDILLIPDPVFIGITGSALLNRVNLSAIACKDELCMSDVEIAIKNVIKQGKRPKAIYVIPDYSNPQGNCMSIEDRRKLLILAEKYKMLIFEDNAYSLMNFGGEKLPSLKSLDKTGRVIYIGTFSKSLFPSARIGYVLGMQYSKQLQTVKSYLSVNTSGIMQAIVGGILLQNNFSLKNYNQYKVDNYRRNCEAMLAELETQFPSNNPRFAGISWNTPKGGFFITVNLPIKFDLYSMHACAKEHKIIVFPSSLLSLCGEHKNQVRLAFSYVSVQSIKLAMTRFGEYVKARLIKEHVPSVLKLSIMTAKQVDPVSSAKDTNTIECASFAAK